MTRVLVTGATGLIGKELVPFLSRTGMEIHAITRNLPADDSGVIWHVGSLFDHEFVAQLTESVKPESLLNLAWATTGDYLVNPINDKFLEAGKNLTRSFARHGGRRAVYVGSCFEYQFKNEPLRESDELAPDRNRYTHCKNELREYAEWMFGQCGVSFGYSRIFYVYGRGEFPTRLTGAVLEHLFRGERFVVKSGPLVKDYIYAKDVAGALTAFLDSSVQGVVNIGTGNGVTIHDYVLALAQKIGRPELIAFEDACSGQSSYVVADVSRLTNEVGYRIQYGLSEALDEIVRYKVR